MVLVARTRASGRLDGGGRSRHRQAQAGQVFWYPGPCTYCAHSAGVKEPLLPKRTRNGTTSVR